MASGVKGAVKPSGGAPTYASTPIATATTTTTLILSICNQGSAADTVRIALVPASVTTSSGAIGDAYYIEYDYSLASKTAYERTGITMESGSRLFVGSGSGNVSFVAYGLES